MVQYVRKGDERMNYRRVGASGLKVSEISLGSWLTYGGYVDEDAAITSIHKAYDLGINLFDTANVYMKGDAESVVGKALKLFPRESYVLATKVFWPMGDGPNDKGLSRKHVTEQCHASLMRMNTDYIDIYYCHRFDPETPLYETLRALDDLVRQGKVLYIGVSEWTPEQIREAAQIADKKLLDRFIVNQPQYNMFKREIETDIIPTSKELGMGQIVWSPLAQGVLTGKYTDSENFPENSRASFEVAHKTMKGFLKKEKLQMVQQLKGVANELNITLPQLALSWVLRQSNVASAIIGASDQEQIEENVKATDIKLSEETVKTIEEIIKKDSEIG
jgi:voltage-dependent potassium channel beta subunit